MLIFATIFATTFIAFLLIFCVFFLEMVAKMIAIVFERSLGMVRNEKRPHFEAVAKKVVAKWLRIGVDNPEEPFLSVFLGMIIYS